MGVELVDEGVYRENVCVVIRWQPLQQEMCGCLHSNNNFTLAKICITSYFKSVKFKYDGKGEQVEKRLRISIEMEFPTARSRMTFL